MTEVCRDCRGSGIAYSEYHPLSDDHEHIRCESCDGFGTEQGKPMTKKPTSAERDALKAENKRFRYYIRKILLVRPLGDCKNKTIIEMEKLCMEALKGGEE